MAFSKQQKNVMIKSYKEWLNQSQAVFVLEYTKMSMKEVDSLRGKVRDAGGQLHVVKNTLMSIVLDQAKIEHATLEGTSLMGFAINDVPAVAKVFLDVTKNSEVYKLKGGYMDGSEVSIDNIKVLAELPPLPVIARQAIGPATGSCWQTRPHDQRTGTLTGLCIQSLFATRRGCPSRWLGKYRIQ